MRILPGPVLAFGLASALVAACSPVEREGGDTLAAAEVAGADPEAAAVLRREMERIDREVARVDSIFQPLPLLTMAEEETLRRFGNAEQLARARQLGIQRNAPPDRLEALRAEGRLVLLEDTPYWIVRDLDHSQPLAVPAVRDFLAELGRRFQQRLAALGAPPYRLEVTSVLRAAADQEALRRVNPNAAAGESTHEYGTTIDVLYSAYSAPDTGLVRLETSGFEWLEEPLRRYEGIALERVAGRRSLEFKAILGHVLIEMQREGRVMVTLERLQPVYHMTIARGGG